MNIKVKKLHEDAVLPKNANETDAGYDIVAIDDGTVTDTYVEYKTGIAIEPPPGYHTEIFPRSSITKTNMVLANSVGLVDESYRGPIIVRFKIVPNGKDIGPGYKKGDKIAQLVIRKTEKAFFEWSDNLSDTARGDGGFGSTGN